MNFNRPLPLPSTLQDGASDEYDKMLAEKWLSELAMIHTVEFRKRGTPYNSPRAPAVCKVFL